MQLVVEAIQQRMKEEPEIIMELSQENPNILQALDELDIDLGLPDVDTEELAIEIDETAS